MPDQFKNFLQKHRSDIDERELPIDLFDQIMEKSFSDQKDSKKSISKFRSITYYAIRVAAASIVLVGIYIVRQVSYNDVKIHSFANINTIQKKENQETSNIELINSSNSTEIEIMRESETGSQVAPKSKIKNTRSVKNKNFSKQVFVDKQVQPPLQNIIAVQNTNNLVEEGTKKSNEEIVETLVNNNNISENIFQPKIEETKLEPKEIASVKALVPITKIEQIQKSSQSESGIISLDEKVKKGIFSFLSRKSREWSNNTIFIDPKIENNNTKLDILVKTEQVAFAKSLKIASF